MTKKTRLIIFLSCVACFFIVAPILIAYSLGYKFNFKDFEFVATGGIYVRSFPAADRIYIDSGTPEKPGLFSNSIFVQGLIPKEHTITIEKDGYQSYHKTLPVVGQEVTKIEDVLLIKEKISYNLIAENIAYFSFSKNNQNVLTVQKAQSSILLEYFSVNNYNDVLSTFSIASLGMVSDIQWSDDSRFALIKVVGATSTSYYIFDTSAQEATVAKLAYLDSNSKKIFFNSQNSTQLYYLDGNNIYLYDGVLNKTNPKATLLVRGVLDYAIVDNNFLWLSLDGFLNQSSLSGTLQAKISENRVSIKSPVYSIFVADGKTFVQEGSNLFILNQQELQVFPSPEPTNKIVLSPDGQHMVYNAGNKINIYTFEDKKYAQLYTGSKISDLAWLNNDYLIFVDQDKIVVLEIDYRGNTNSATLSSQMIVQDYPVIDLKPTQSFYNRQDNKIYFLSEKNLISSEKLVP